MQARHTHTASRGQPRRPGRLPPQRPAFSRPAKRFVISPSCTAAPDVGVSGHTAWVQKTFTLPQQKRGCHIITRKVLEAVPELAAFECGLANLFILHTSASLTINENASAALLGVVAPLSVKSFNQRNVPPGTNAIATLVQTWPESDVPLDLNDTLDRLVPEGSWFRHLDEGPDDMPAHVKSSLMGPSLTVPITKGRLALGTWQGIYLNEHHNYGGPRTLVVTVQGVKRPDGRTYSQWT